MPDLRSLRDAVAEAVASRPDLRVTRSGDQDAPWMVIRNAHRVRIEFYAVPDYVLVVYRDTVRRFPVSVDGRYSVGSLPERNEEPDLDTLTEYDDVEGAAERLLEEIEPLFQAG